MLSRNTFDDYLAYLSDIKGWKLSDGSLALLYKQVSEQVEDDDFMRIVSRIADDPDPYAKPSAIAQACAQHRKIQANATPPPALPPAPIEQGRPPCDEYIRFLRLRDWLAENKGRIPRHAPTRSWEQVRDEPITDTERTAARRVDPASAISAVLPRGAR